MLIRLGRQQATWFNWVGIALFTSLFLLAIFIAIESRAAVSPPWAFTIRETLTIGMMEKCTEYVGLVKKPAPQCRSAANRLAEVLDSDTAYIKGKKNFGGYVAFKSELLTLLENDDVLSWINELEETLANNSMTEDLFSWTLKRAQNDKVKAFQWIAVVLQDTTTQYHLDYLTAKYGNRFAQQVEKLRGINASILKVPDLKLFPPGIESNDRAIYHFYVIGYLSKKLSEKPDSFGMHFRVPFFFNTLYEFFTDGCGDKLRPFCMKPKEISDPQNLEDVYLGYISGKWVMDQLDTSIPRETFFQEFAKAPVRWTKQYMRGEIF